MGKSFQSQVREYRTKHKCGVTKAMKAVVRSDPEAHKAYLESGGGPIDRTEDDETKSFEQLVDEHMERNGCGKVDAMRTVIRLHPNVHRAYIERENQ